jgi:glutamyl-Q tRNA(Asp) synthetase
VQVITETQQKKIADRSVGRFAPSPTGPLHFGSLLTAVASFCLARRSGGRWLLRMEDLDRPRVVSGAAAGILRDLERFGFEWDGEVLFQSRRDEFYEAALAQLRQAAVLFACGCSRKEILASAPHPGEEGPIYSGTCRHGLPAGRQARAERLRVDATPIVFDDGLYGRQEQNLAAAVGDFVLKRADGLFAYQLAVVVDDAASGVNQVVRGADLISSTPRQIYLQRLLGLPSPGYWHLPLALDAHGEKISKRHGAAMSEQSPAEMLWRVFGFLGQEPPAALRGAPPRELLAWGVEHFEPERIDRRARSVAGEW